VHRLGRMLVLTEEAGDARRVLDQADDRVVEVGLHQHVAGEELALGVDLLAAANLDDLLGRNDDLLYAVTQALLLGLVVDVLRDLLLEVRIGVDNVPPRSHPKKFSKTSATRSPVSKSPRQRPIPRMSSTP